MDVRVSEIIVGDRVRQGHGFLDSLERSIQELGVLQPIGITPDKRLIFGARRLQACKNIGLETMPARVFDIDADDPVTALQMEHDENGQRVDLTPSEKVEIVRRIEETLAGRHGGDRKSSDNNLPLEKPVGRSDDIAAKAVGMNRETYRQAKAVVDSGNREIIEQMDTGQKSVSKAYEEVRPRPAPRTIKVTLYKNPADDAEVLLLKGGKEYCTKLGIALLKAAGHNVEV